MKGALRLVEERGTGRELAVVPIEEVIQPEPAQLNLIQRVWAAVRGKLPEVRLDKDPLTTDIGFSLQANVQSFSALDRYDEAMRLSQQRKALFDDYDRMDEECVEVSTALDITVGHVFLPMDSDQESHEIVSDDQKVIDIIEDCDRRVEMHEILPEWCKTLLKWGDSFEEIVCDATPQVSRLKYLNPRYMKRNEDRYGRLIPERAFVQVDEAGQDLIEFQAWQVVHTRFRHERGNLYGNSFYKKSRRPFRQLAMMEDGCVIRRLTKSGKKYAFYIPVPKNAQPEEKKKVVEEAIRRLKRRASVDANGKLDLRRSPLAEEEDIYIPVEEGAEGRAKVEVFDPGGINDNLNDVVFFRDKVLLPTNVPKAYLGLEADTRGRAMLGWQDINFGRNIRTIQKLMAGAQRKVYDVELILKGVIPTQDLYTVKYPPISMVDEQMKLAVEQAKWTLAQTAKTSLGIPLKWLLENIVKLPEKDVEFLVANLEEPQSQSQGWGGGGGWGSGGGGFSGGQGGFGERDMRAIKDSVYSNMRLQGELFDLREKLRVIVQERLLEPVEVNVTPSR
jgi:hypothetical protein